MLSIEAVATVYGVLMSLAPLLQARKIVQRRSSADVSTLYLIVLLVGFSLYLAYGISISNRLLIITNTVSIVATAATLLVAVWFLAQDVTEAPAPVD
ncbi:MAG: SemiSWEET family transporter [Actinomycetota bacterium]